MMTTILSGIDYLLAAGWQIPKSSVYGRSGMLGVLRAFCQNWTLHIKWYVGGTFEEALSEMDFA